MEHPNPKIVIVGAGIGGLAASLRLAHGGYEVTVIEAQPYVGGKMRTLPSDAGPVDAGPTVLTMRPVFEALFADCGLQLNDHVTLEALPVIARHFWDDGCRMDLLPGREATVAEVTRVFGASAARDYTRFADRAARLFAAFDAPMMQAASPRTSDLAWRVMKSPGLAWDMAPWTSLAGLLKSSFAEPKLAQLFGRYATYVGGSPLQSPALLSLIADAEAQGVWSVKGGMHALAQAIRSCAESAGATFILESPVQRLQKQGGRICAVETNRTRIEADAVLFNGDPRALTNGLLGESTRHAVAQDAVEPRSFSATVAGFAAVPHGAALAHHNVFFSNGVNAEFPPLDRNDIPTDPTLYLCAQDHGTVDADALQRFEIIMNAAPVMRDENQEKSQCQTLILRRFKDFGLTFSPTPKDSAWTTPTGFDKLFPASLGSLYGRSPHGMTAGMKRPTARTAVPGLYLVGGGAHPGAGVPMATLSAAHAAGAIMQDLCLTSTSRKTAMHGGMSTGSATAGVKPSLS